MHSIHLRQDEYAIFARQSKIKLTELSHVHMELYSISPSTAQDMKIFEIERKCTHIERFICGIRTSMHVNEDPMILVPT